MAQRPASLAWRARRVWIIAFLVLSMLAVMQSRAQAVVADSTCGNYSRLVYYEGQATFPSWSNCHFAVFEWVSGGYVTQKHVTSHSQQGCVNFVGYPAGVTGSVTYVWQGFGSGTAGPYYAYDGPNTNCTAGQGRWGGGPWSVNVWFFSSDTTKVSEIRSTWTCGNSCSPMTLSGDRIYDWCCW